jgi:hypothetical protein
MYNSDESFALKAHCIKSDNWFSYPIYGSTIRINPEFIEV